jgi:hypothetical protein
VSQQEDSLGTVGCRHYWVIELAGGRMSRGRCSRCGAAKDFPNYFGDCVSDSDLFERWISKRAVGQPMAERLKII